MGQIPQDGNFGQKVFFLKKSLRVTKSDGIGLIVQLILAHWVLYTLGTLQPSLGKHFLVPCGAPVLALLSHFFGNFWVIIRALVRPNPRSWTGFDLLIVLVVKF